MRKFSTKMMAAAVGLVAMFSTLNANAAAIVGLQLEGGGTQQVFALDNGNFLSLWGFDNREGANPGAGAVDINSAADIIGGFVSGTVVGLYNGANPVNAGASEFDALTYSFTIADDARLFDSLWVEWTGGTLVYAQPNGRSRSTANSTNITRDGDPFPRTVPVSEPTPIALLGLGLLMAGIARRRRS